MAKKSKKLSDKRKLTYAIISTVLLFAIINGSFLIIESINTANTKNQTIATSDKPAADHLKEKAFDAFTNKKFTQAKALYSTAKKQYDYVFENSDDQSIRDAARNNAEDCKQMIFQIGLQTS